MEQRPFWEIHSITFCQQIRCILWNLKVYCHGHNSTSLDFISSWIQFVPSSSSLFRIGPCGFILIRINLELCNLQTNGRTPQTGYQPCRKVATYTQDNTKTEETQTDIHNSTVDRTHDYSVRTGEATVISTPSSVSFKCMLISSSRTHIFLPEVFIRNFHLLHAFI
jgi:hypothetical protein